MARPARFPPADLDLATVREGGVLFETGRPVRFRYVHNEEKAPQLGARFGQDIEPSGFYVLHVPENGSAPPRGWTSGLATLEHPLVLTEAFDRDAIYGPTGWKARLHAATKKRRRALSRYLLGLGFDSIVPVHRDPKHGDSTTEIVLLRA